MPSTPRHSRHVSKADSDATRSPQARRQSKSSLHDPTTPLRASFNQQELEISVLGSGGAQNASNGLGNLADELADALSDGDDDEYYEHDENATALGKDALSGEAEATQGDAAEAVTLSSTETRTQKTTSTLGLPSSDGRGHRRAPSEYDGSEYGSESDLETSSLPASLIAKLDAVESLARRGTEVTGSPADGAFKRVTDGLRDLGSQSGVEGGASRLITAHSALTTHLSHQTRQLHNLTFPLLSPLVPPPTPETIETLLPMLISLSDSMPRPTTSAYISLTALHGLTADLVQTLSYLSDTLHMSRQTTTTATRRLKSARELVAELRREEELREEGERWLTRGNWGERLRKRECANVCGEVVGGFEEVCNGWRARLLAQVDFASA